MDQSDPGPPERRFSPLQPSARSDCRPCCSPGPLQSSVSSYGSARSPGFSEAGQPQSLGTVSNRVVGRSMTSNLFSMAVCSGLVGLIGGRSRRLMGLRKRAPSQVPTLQPLSLRPLKWLDDASSLSLRRRRGCTCSPTIRRAETKIGLLQGPYLARVEAVLQRVAQQL